MPSTTSSSVSSDLASSTVMTPSLPTFFMASARNLTISATTASTARSIPRLRSIGFMPAATALAPSFTMAAASTVAVVVPSPAASADLEATSRTIWAPMFSNLSSSSISLATVTPSLVMRGAPNDLSSTTLRPFGPSVTRTAWERVSMPRSILSRASTENFTSLAAILVTPIQRDYWVIFRGSRLLLAPWDDDEIVKTLRDLFLGHGLDHHAHDIALLHDQEFGVVDLDLGARPLAERHPVTDLEVDRDDPAGFVAPAGTDGDDLALAGLFLGGIGDDDAAGGLVFSFDTLDDNTIV